MELRANVPFKGWDFDDFNEVGRGVNTGAFHAMAFKLLEVFVVELIAVTVALFDRRQLSVSFPSPAAFRQFTLIAAKAHGSTHLGDIFLFFHHVDDVVRSPHVHLAAVGIGLAQYVASKLNDHHLHTQANAKSRDVMSAGVLRSDDFAFDATLSETGANDDAG